MKVMNKKHLRLFLLAVLSAFCIGQAVGQNILKTGFAGRDWEFLFPITGVTEMVYSIGEDVEAGQSDEYVQYYWTLVTCSEGASAFFGEVYGVDDLKERKSPKPKVCLRPYQGNATYLFRCDRVSKYGYQSETITVGIYNRVTIDAKPNRNCWAAGEKIKVEEFSITTVPSGYEKYVILDMDSHVAASEDVLQGGEEEQTVRFIMGNDLVGEGTAKIVVYYPMELNGSFYVNRGLIQAIKALEAGQNWKEHADRIKNMTEPLKKLAGDKFDFDWSAEGHCDFAIKGICGCNEKRALVSIGNIGASASLSVSATAYPLMGWPVYATIGLSGSIGLNGGPLNIDIDATKDCSCGSLGIITVPVTISLFGGVGLAAGSPDFLSLGGEIAGNFNTGVELTVNPNKVDLKLIKPDLNVVLTVRGVCPFGKLEYKWTIYD